ncbi:DUF937 domain-containing protein [Rubripirellula reticaptiva]|uniref:DUF937 domain-containing protein n=1 Tax=Rubripirellula reticaptiva TaxID=2528013 RepID=A0A5C6F2R2_9BACT|nr:DUF937 domain-containing protein [Rubripirellula reticaptiva]TWU55415.1 hypothetical protein Poly59_17130 [Rubripirellula reticaptiva]
MPINVLDELERHFAGGRLGKQIGLDDGQAKSGMNAILPSILGTLIKKTSTQQGADSLNHILGQDDFSGSLLNKLPSMFGDETAAGDLSMVSDLGMPVLASLFGDNIASVVGVLSKYTGVGPDKTKSMMVILTPLVLCYLGSKKRLDDLDAGGMASLLMSQKDAVASSLPPEMAATLGLGELGIADFDSAEIEIPTSRRQPVVSSGNGTVWWLPVLVVVALTAWFIVFGGSTDSSEIGVEVAIDGGNSSPN